MASHRYWRLNISACMTAGGYPDVETFELLAGGTSIATNAGSAYASSSYTPGNYGPGNAVVGQPGQWSAAGPVPQWWGYDFGAGGSADISAVRLTLRSETSPGWNTTSPTAFDVQWSDDNSTWTTGWSAATSPTAASQVITVSAPPSTVTVTPDNAAIVYSPYNWQVTALAATTWNPGAYFRTLFTGAACAVTFDMSVAVVPYSQFWWRVDNGPWTLASVAASVALNIPAITTNNAAVPFHRLEVVVKSMDIASGVNRWAAASPGAVRFTGIMLATGASLLAPGRAPLNVLIYGDSITEGARTLGEASATTVADMDAMFGWAFEQGRLLGAEVGIVGFSGTGYLNPAYSVPAFPGSYAFLAAGLARSFAPGPDLVVVNHGQNDGSADVKAAAVSAVNGLLAACPAAKVVLLNPLPPGDNTFLQAAVAACTAPGRAAWVSTAGFFIKAAGADAVQVHPSGPNDVGLIAPRVAGALRPFLPGAAALVARWTH